MFSTSLYTFTAITILTDINTMVVNIETIVNIPFKVTGLILEPFTHITRHIWIRIKLKPTDSHQHSGWWFYLLKNICWRLCWNGTCPCEAGQQNCWSGISQYHWSHNRRHTYGKPVVPGCCPHTLAEKGKASPKVRTYNFWLMAITIMDQ